MLKTVSLLDLCVGGSWALVLHDSASKSQTNGLTREGTRCSYLRAKRQLGVTEPVTLIDGSKSQQALWLQNQPLLHLCFNFLSVTNLSNSNMGKCCVADCVNTTDSLGGNDLGFLFIDCWFLSQLFRKSVNTHSNGPQVAADRSASALQATTHWALSAASHHKLKAESTPRHCPEISALNERNPVDIKENQAPTSAASCNVYWKNPIRIMT